MYDILLLHGSPWPRVAVIIGVTVCRCPLYAEIEIGVDYEKNKLGIARPGVLFSLCRWSQGLDWDTFGGDHRSESNRGRDQYRHPGNA